MRDCGVEHVLIGCMRNAAAVMRSAVARAMRLDRSISLVCAGREQCLIPGLDDSYCAAVLLCHGEELARSAGVSSTLRESAKIARNAASFSTGIPAIVVRQETVVRKETKG